MFQALFDGGISPVLNIFRVVKIFNDLDPGPIEAWLNWF